MLPLSIAQAAPQVVRMPGPSPVVLLVLIAMLVASIWVYARLTHLWTARRPYAAMQEWARCYGFKVCHTATVQLPGVLGQIGDDVRVGRVLMGERTTIAQVETSAGRWHVIVREFAARSATEVQTPAWPATGLRPADRAVPWMEAMTKRTFPTLLPPERFVVVGSERAAAEALAQSSVKARLPADVAMMVVGHSVLLEFSTRPFDGVEFTRLLAVLEQVMDALPPLMFEES